MYYCFYTGISLPSRLIRFRSWRDRSHVSVIPEADQLENHLAMGSAPAYLQTCALYEPWIDSLFKRRGRVYKREGISEGHKPGTRIDIYRHGDNVPLFNIGAARYFCQANVGMPYDFGGMLGFFSRRDAAQDPEAWFCSEYAFTASAEGGVRLLERIPAHRIDPGLLETSPYLVYVCTVITGPAPIVMVDPRRAQSPVNAAAGSDGSMSAKTGKAAMHTHTAPTHTHAAPRPVTKRHSIAPPPLQAANSIPDGLLDAANQVTLTHATFEVVQDGLFVPFGDYPNIGYDARGNGHDIIQRWDVAAANAVIADLATDTNGRPVYRGHPDMPAMKADWPDKDAKGWIHTAVITSHNGKPGVRFVPKYNDEGLDIVNQAKLKFPSPFWLLSIVSANANGADIVSPTRLISMGLLNDPNIPVPAVANQAPPKPGGDPANNKETVMRDQLIAMLKAAGVEVPADITDEALIELANTTLQGATATAETATQQVAEAEAKVEAEKTNAANARTTAATAIVDLAIVQGKLPQAKREEQLGKFKDNFTAANGAIQLLDPILPIDGSRTRDMGKRNTEIQDENLDAANARQEFRSLVEQEEGRLRSTMTAANSGRIHDLAWGNIQRANKAVYDRAYAKKEG